MTREHDAIEELLAVRSLGGLDGDDVATLDRLLAAHGDCAECRRLESGFAGTAADLALALDPVEVDPTMVDRILSETPAQTAPMARDEVGERRARRAGRGWVTAVAVAAVVVLVVGSIAFVRSRSTSPSSVSWAQRVVTFDGEGDAELAMAYVPGQSGAVFWGDDLPDPGAGQTYEIWMIQGETPVSGGCVTPTDGRVALFVDANVSEAELMAVTLEPEVCPDAPTGDVVLSVPLV